VPTFALTDAFLYVAGYDLTADTNQIQLTAEAAQLDKTTFASAGWREHVNGLKTSTLTGAGFWQSDTTNAVDPQVFPNLGTSGRVVTLGDVQTEGQPAYMLQSMIGSYTWLDGGIGELAGFTVNAACADGIGVIRGQLAKERGAVSATGALGTAVNLGAPITGQYVYCTVHVFTAGTTITLQLQSDTASNFPSATTQATIGPLTTAGGTWMTRLAGPFAGESWWRLNVSGVTGTFTVAAAIGVQ
jgi:hypothetical protein